MDTKQKLINILNQSASVELPDLGNLLMIPKDSTNGDFTLPCFQLAKIWKISPPEASKKLLSLISLPDEIEKVVPVGPYLNFFLNRKIQATSIINKILEEGSNYGKEKHKETIIVEYSSPNIAKPFHIGHLRTTLIGHALDRTLRHLGYNVISINHLGDWGAQFGFVWAGCKLWGRPENPDIDDLVEVYKRATTLKKQQDENTVPSEDKDKPDINLMAREYFLRLEDNDSEALEFWQWCLDISLKYLKLTYQRLGVHFDFYTGESFYRDQLENIEKNLKESNVLTDSRGALGVDLGDPLGFVRIFAEDGRSLYITRDIAAADYRYKTYSPEKIIYVVGAPQILHFKQLIGVLNAIKHPVAEKIVHVPYGHVPGISTRAGKTNVDTSLKALLREAHDRALNAYKTQVSKRPEDVDEELVAESVGLSAIFFHYLSRSNIKDFYFIWDEALSFQGDTGPYLQYALARINSIESKAKEAGLVLDDISKLNGEYLSSPEVYEIVKLLGDFPNIIKKTALDYEPAHIAQYALDLAKVFSANYKSLRVLGESDTNKSLTYLALFKAVANVMKISMGLIGVPVLDKM
jgi:arginyl-tRNA synthetase